MTSFPPNFLLGDSDSKYSHIRGSVGQDVKIQFWGIHLSPQQMSASPGLVVSLRGRRPRSEVVFLRTCFPEVFPGHLGAGPAGPGAPGGGYVACLLSAADSLRPPRGTGDGCRDTQVDTLYVSAHRTSLGKRLGNSVCFQVTRRK